MSCKENCSKDKKGYTVPAQKIISLGELKKELANQDNPHVYCYIIDTIKYNNDQRFIQCGTGPNFQGDLITLCTCKHLMRSSLNFEDWEGEWVAGFTGKNCVEEHKGKNFIVYLMKISEAFKSFHQLWNNGIKDEVKNTKAAHQNEYGDIYVPNDCDESACFQPEHYVNPCERFDRIMCWHKDINYQGYSNRRAALLVGDQKKSFLWNKPNIYFEEKLHRKYRKLKLKDFLKKLEQIKL